MSLRSRAFHGRFASSTSISSTSAGGSFGGTGHVADCSKGAPSWWRRRFATHAFWYCFEGEHCGVGLLLHSFEERSFNVHLYLTPKPHSLRVFWRESVRLKKFTIPIREQPHRPYSHWRTNHSKHRRRHNRHTHQKTQGNPNTLHLRNGTEDLEHFARRSKQIL